MVEVKQNQLAIRNERLSWNSMVGNEFWTSTESQRGWKYIAFKPQKRLSKCCSLHNCMNDPYFRTCLFAFFLLLLFRLFQCRIKEYEKLKTNLFPLTPQNRLAWWLPSLSFSVSSSDRTSVFACVVCSATESSLSSSSYTDINKNRIQKLAKILNNVSVTIVSSTDFQTTTDRIFKKWVIFYNA